MLKYALYRFKKNILLKRTINCRGNVIDLSQPKVMAILNFTPDSFYKSSRAKSDLHLLNKIEDILMHGATFIDLGAYSSRPGASFVSIKDEGKRLFPALKMIYNEFPNALISVDTFRSSIAMEAIDMGVAIINDISGGDLDQDMFSLVSRTNTPYIMMHMRGHPKNMQSLNTYNYLIQDIITELQTKANRLIEMGHNDLIIDPGFGFSKNIEQNYELLCGLKSLEILDCPILVGISRKSMVYKVLEIDANNSLNGSTVLHTFSLLNGASILRVHDVKEAIEAIKITNLLKK